jgi:hypothetical protein
MGISEKTKITVGFIIGVGTLATPPVVGLVVMYADQKAQAQAITTLQNRQDTYDQDLKKILDGLGEVKGQLKNLTK